YAISQLSIDVSSTIQNTITMMYINRLDSKNDQIFLRSIFKDCIDQSNPSILVRDMFNLDLNILSWRSNTLDLDHFNHIWVFGAGKAAASMAQGYFEVLKNRIDGGIVICPNPGSQRVGNIEFHPGNHPIPGPESLQSTAILIQALSQTKPNDLIFFLISGGASAMLCKP